MKIRNELFRVVEKFAAAKEHTLTVALGRETPDNDFGIAFSQSRRFQGLPFLPLFDLCRQFRYITPSGLGMDDFDPSQRGAVLPVS
jgi:hypothetical protein